eukprot:TRINITY_DN75835_c0_g1_i1.p1 TRINITY_DN75835_c0_g1~~TRINITY_DN75835_c0_g1_i1.p1  ORF type:complete len:583 (+),score=103.19 TRINITY_DN75835_c0_g1_i1:35-1783(+)
MGGNDAEALGAAVPTGVAAGAQAGEFGVGASEGRRGPTQAPTSPYAMYPPPRQQPKREASLFQDGDSFLGIYGANAPVFKKPEPLPPVGAVFFFRVVGEASEQPVFANPSEDAEQIGSRQNREVVRVTDFKGKWVRLAVDTEAQREGAWEAWMVAEEADGTLLEEIEDPAEHEKEFTKDLFKRLWKVNDHVVTRLKEKTERGLQYLQSGRLPPGKKDILPEGTRCVNAFWGLEARFIKLGEGEEYWPQGCLTLSQGYVRSGWEQPSEEARSGHWRVFAARPFEAHELVEVCPLVPVDLETCMASFQLRMNVVETPADEDAEFTGKIGKVKSFVPLGYGMLYQQSIELEDVKVNWTPVSNFNCKFVPVKDHMYIYATRKIQADEELVLEYQRCFRTEQGESIDFTGFTPYWCRREPPESFAKALVAPCGPRKVRPIPGRVKFGKSALHGRGTFADASYKKGEVVEMSPCLLLDTNGADCMQDYCFQLPDLKVEVEGRSLVKRHSKYVLPCGYGGMYNHLESGQGENVQWFYDETTQCMVWVAHPKEGEEIQRNEELCFDYGQAYWDAPSRRQQRPSNTSLGNG